MDLLKRIIPDERCDMVLLVWPSMYMQNTNWKQLLKIFHNIISILLKNRNHVFLIISNIRDIKKEIDNIKEKNKLVDLKKYLHVLEYNCDDIWIRDFGPQQIEIDDKDSYYFYEYSFNAYGNKYPHDKDKSFTQFFLNHFIKTLDDQNYLLHEKPFHDLIIEGGNIQSNNRGLIVFNKRCLLKNNNQSWRDIKPYFDKAINNNNIKKYLFFDLEPLSGDDTNGHLDNLIRLYKENLLFYMSTDDIEHPDFYLLKELKNQLDILNKKTFIIDKMIPIKHTSEDILKNEIGSILPFSYLNYIITNNVVIFPVIKNNGALMKKKISPFFDNKKIYLINIEGLLNEFGGLHCCSLNISY